MCMCGGPEGGDGHPPGHGGPRGRVRVRTWAGSSRPPRPCAAGWAQLVGGGCEGCTLTQNIPGLEVLNDVCVGGQRGDEGIDKRICFGCLDEQRSAAYSAALVRCLTLRTRLCSYTVQVGAHAVAREAVASGIVTAMTGICTRVTVRGDLAGDWVSMLAVHSLTHAETSPCRPCYCPCRPWCCPCRPWCCLCPALVLGSIPARRTPAPCRGWLQKPRIQ